MPRLEELQKAYEAELARLREPIERIQAAAAHLAVFVVTVGQVPVANGILHPSSVDGHKEFMKRICTMRDSLVEENERVLRQWRDAVDEFFKSSLHDEIAQIEAEKPPEPHAFNGTLDPDRFGPQPCLRCKRHRFHPCHVDEFGNPIPYRPK